MKFSIITITYNSERYLEKTLESVQEQSFQDYEHLVWDGGSSDGTIEIVKKFPKIKIRIGKDKGISDAMNKGAEIAKGEFLLHLHSDDMLHCQDTLHLVNAFLENRPDLSWIYGQAEVIDSEGNLIRTTKHIPYKRRLLRKYNIITHPSSFVSRKLFIESGGFRKDLRYCMDYELWLRLSKIASAKAMPFIVSKFREHNHSLSSRETLKVSDEAYKVRNEYVRNIWERYRSYRTWKRRRKAIKT